MRIGLDITPLITEYYSGVQSHIQNQAEALVDRFLQDEFVLTGLIPRATQRRLRQWPIWSKGNVTWGLRPLPARMFHFLGDRWQRVGWPPVEAIFGQIDVYHTFDWFTFSSRARQTATVYDLTPQLFPQWHTQGNRQVFYKRMEAVVKRAQVLVAISQATKNDLKQEYPNYRGRVEVVYPDCAPLFSPSDQGNDQAVMKRYGMLPGYFLVVGTIEPRKNLKRVVEAYRNLPLNIQTKRELVVIGVRGWERESVWNKLRQAEGVRLLGYVSNNELPAFYRQARALLFPSLYEGFGIPVLEALRCGCLVLTSKTSSLPEVGGKAAFYCDPEDPEDLLQKMIAIDRLNAAMAAKRRMLGFDQAKKFSYTKSAEQMMGIWQRLMR